MTFRITALPVTPFVPLFALDDTLLAMRGARREIAAGGEPCRISLTDAAPGERLILTHYEHQPADTPFRAGHAIYIREDAEQVHPDKDEVPYQLRTRTLSLRGFDFEGMMLVADLADGAALEEGVAPIFADPAVDYIHLHFAKPGCYAARVDRV